MFWDRIGELIQNFWTDFLPDLVLLVVLLTGLLTYRWLTVSGRVVLAFLGIALLVTSVSFGMAFYHLRNHFLFPLLALAEFGCFGLFYLIEIRTKAVRRVILPIMGSYLVLFVLEFDAMSMNDILIGLARLLLIGFVLTHFWSLMAEMKVTNLVAHPPFWVSIAVLLNGAGTVFIYLFKRLTLTSATRNEYFSWYWGVTQAFLIVFYGLLAYSFWLRRRAVLSPATTAV
jgi:hypothetical protein